jgi:hypothetical protein
MQNFRLASNVVPAGWKNTRPFVSITFAGILSLASILCNVLEEREKCTNKRMVIQLLCFWTLFFVLFLFI